MKRFTKVMLTAGMLSAMLCGSALAAYDSDFVVTGNDNYTVGNGYITLNSTGGNYTISMAEGVAKTDDYIVISTSSTKDFNVTLDNVCIVTDNEYALQSVTSGELTINLVGENTLSSAGASGKNSITAGFWSDDASEVTITSTNGTGSLYVKGGDATLESSGITVQNGVLYITDCAVEAVGGTASDSGNDTYDDNTVASSFGIVVSNVGYSSNINDTTGLIIENSDVTATSGTGEYTRGIGIYQEGNAGTAPFTISSDSTVCATGEDAQENSEWAESAGMYLVGVAIDWQDSEIEAYSGEGYFSYGIYGCEGYYDSWGKWNYPTATIDTCEVTAESDDAWGSDSSALYLFYTTSFVATDSEFMLTSNDSDVNSYAFYAQLMADKNGNAPEISFDNCELELKSTAKIAITMCIVGSSSTTVDVAFTNETIVNIEAQSNDATSSSAYGMRFSYATVSAEDSEFYLLAENGNSNYAFNTSKTAVAFENCVIEATAGEGSSNSRAISIPSAASYAEFIDCEVTASAYGHGIYVAATPLTIDGGVFEIIAQGSSGMGIYFTTGDCTLTDCEVEIDAASCAIYGSSTGTLTTENATITLAEDCVPSNYGIYMKSASILFDEDSYVKMLAGTGAIYASAGIMLHEDLSAFIPDADGIYNEEIEHTDEATTFYSDEEMCVAVLIAIEADTVATDDDDGPRSTASEYDVDVESSKNGDTEVDKDEAKQYALVTITTDPDAGYEVDEVIVTDEDGEELDVTDNGDGTYSFRMPAGDVTVEVTYTASGETVTGSPFIDLSTDSDAFEAIMALYEANIIYGMTDTTFGGDLPITRGMITTMLHRIMGTPSVFAEGFSDVADGQWYTAGVLWADSEGIVSGYTDGTFMPTQEITNQEMCMILMNFAIYCGVEVDENLSANDVADWSATAVAWAMELGMYEGEATDVVTRELACEMIYAVLEYLADVL